MLDLDAVDPVLEVKLGGKTLLAREQTVEKNKEVLRSIAKSEDAAGKDDENSTKAGLKALDSVYDQVEEILIDKATGKPPSRNFVEKHLTNARLRKLMENLGEEDDEGKSPGSTGTTT